MLVEGLWYAPFVFKEDLPHLLKAALNELKGGLVLLITKATLMGQAHL